MFVESKRIIIIFLIATFILVFNSISFAEVSESDEQGVYNALKTVIDAINSDDVDTVTELVSQYAVPGLKNDIKQTLFGKTTRIDQNISSMEYIDKDVVKVKGKFAAAGLNWNISGLSNYYILERIDDSWYIKDTDFHKKLSAKYVFKIVGIIFAILIPFGLFWLWMLVDCIKTPIDNKMVWILLIVFLNILGAILYFFIPRRKFRKINI